VATLMLGGRPVSMVAREMVAPRNYVALWRSRRVYPHPLDGARRYFLGRGEYPCAFEVRTPAGIVAPTLHHPHDMFTVNEVFCREDYAAGAHLRVAVDLGSNIGISALYFLTRHPAARVWCYEPVPRNARRLEDNLAAYRDRFALERAAVASAAGRVRFGVEESGRYGGIGRDTGQEIEVECLAINDVLADVLAEVGRIDVLKVDTEGAELATVKAIAPEHLDRIDTIYLEVERPELVHPDRFEATFANETLALTRRRSP
jgi:FkbM family methyltransferase